MRRALVIPAAIIALAVTGSPAAAATCHTRQAGLLPSASCTPGAVSTRRPADVCTPGWATAHRNVAAADRRAAFDEYGVDRATWPAFPAAELDHLIPLELGGSNTLRNLWPERAPGAKDRIEDALHDAVCAGRILLRSAQHRIRTDWRTALRGL